MKHILPHTFSFRFQRGLTVALNDQTEHRAQGNVQLTHVPTRSCKIGLAFPAETHQAWTAAITFLGRGQCELKSQQRHGRCNWTEKRNSKYSGCLPENNWKGGLEFEPNAWRDQTRCLTLATPLYCSRMHGCILITRLLLSIGVRLNCYTPRATKRCRVAATGRELYQLSRSFGKAPQTHKLPVPVILCLQ